MSLVQRMARGWMGLVALAMLFVLAGCDPNGGEPKGAQNEVKEAKPDKATYVVVHKDPVALPKANGNLERILAAKVMRIGVKADTPPFGFQDKDGNPQGFDVELGARIARTLGVQPVFVPVTSAERLPRLEKGDVDVIIATLTATRKRAHEIDFSLPYFEDHQSLLVAVGSTIQSPADLAGKKVAALTNSTSVLNLKTVAPDSQLKEVATNDAGFELLKSGQVDALTGDRVSLLGIRLKSGEPEKYRVAGDGFSIEPYVIGIPRGDSELRNRIDEALTEIWTSGVWTRLFNKWLGHNTPYDLEAKFQMPVLPP